MAAEAVNTLPEAEANEPVVARIAAAEAAGMAAEAVNTLPEAEANEPVVASIAAAAEASIAVVAAASMAVVAAEANESPAASMAAETRRSDKLREIDPELHSTDSAEPYRFEPEVALCSARALKPEAVDPCVNW
jgi:hypothetical protein